MKSFIFIHIQISLRYRPSLGLRRLTVVPKFYVSQIHHYKTPAFFLQRTMDSVKFNSSTGCLQSIYLGTQTEKVRLEWVNPRWFLCLHSQIGQKIKGIISLTAWRKEVDMRKDRGSFHPASREKAATWREGRSAYASLSDSRFSSVAGYRLAVSITIILLIICHSWYIRRT